MIPHGEGIPEHSPGIVYILHQLTGNVNSFCFFHKKDALCPCPYINVDGQWAKTTGFCGYSYN
jgi:hypothetical protein